MISFPVIAGIIVALYILSSIKILAEYERGVIFRLGRLLPQAKGPGIILVFGPFDRMVRISLRQEALEVPPQDIITRDNVTLKVNAVIFPASLIRGARSWKFQTTCTRRHSLRRPRCARCWAKWNWTSCWPTATRSTCVCRAFSTRTPIPGV